MKCQSCNTDLNENAKFCTNCGHPIKTARANKVTNETNQVFNSKDDVLSNVKGMIYWNIQQGEIARRINEVEFEQYDSARGVIIEEGTTAYIKVNGEKVAELSGGVYNFVDPSELDKILESRGGGLAGGVKKGWRWVINAVLGKKSKERVYGYNDEDISSLDSLDKILDCLYRDTVFSITLKRDSDFELLFGIDYNSTSDYQEYRPMIIRSKYLDVQMGLRAMFRITDFEQFSKQYMLDRASISAAYLSNILSSIVKASIQKEMHEEELTSNDLSDSLYQRISRTITSATNGAMRGISLTNIIEITADNNDIDRFRNLSRELYLSEKELDHLTRANDFKNRLNIQVDEQELYDARRLRNKDEALKAINKDQLLSDNEFAKFVELLDIENRIRQARSNDELDALYDELAFNKLERNHNYYIQQLGNEAVVAEKKRKQDRDARLAEAQTKVDEETIRDEYEWKKDGRAIDRDFDIQHRDLEFKQKQAAASLEHLRSLKQIEAEEAQNAHNLEMDTVRSANEHEINLKNIKREEIETMSNLSPEQLMAIAANENLSPEVAAKFAESFASKYAGVNQQELMIAITNLNQARIEDKEKEAQRLERMMRDMMQTASNMAGSAVQNSEALKQEYKERLERQEDRIDKTQDSALNYATKNNILAPQVGIESFYQIKSDGKEYQKFTYSELLTLINFGSIQQNTLIYSSVTNDWREALAIQELSSLFN